MERTAVQSNTLVSVGYDAATSELEIEFRLSPEALARKVRAVEEHVSQVEPLTAMLGRQILFDSQNGEYFRLASRTPPA